MSQISYTQWLAENSYRADEMVSEAQVISTGTVKEKIEEIISYEEKSEILFEIVKPQTSKTLREITAAELRELALNFKDGL